jgi:predicted CXXCH cytochrome family protein
MRALLVLAALLAFTAVAVASPEGPPPIMRDCGTCHVPYMGEMLLLEPLSLLCIECHADRVEADHVVDVVPSMDVVGLPLDKDGRMTCATCHDPHDRRGIWAMLRDEPKKLCGRCHRK